MRVNNAGSIPWSRNERGGMGQNEVTQEKLKVFAEMFQDDCNQQLAYKTIVSEVLRCRLAWHVASAETADDSIPVPDWWSTFVTDAIRSILINGNFIYRRCGERVGVPVCVVADPASVYTVWCRKTCKYVSSCRKHRWMVGLVEPPRRGTGTHESAMLVNSASKRAERPTRQLSRVMANWVVRDKANSSSTVYTAISDDIRQQNGSDRQWFRNVNSGDTINTRVNDIDTGFHTLVHRRAETIEKLDSITNLARSRSSAANAGLTRVGEVSKAACGPSHTHQEHMVSDGRVYTEARQLSSMADSKMMIDELKHSILFAFGVPPQALGQNINSERIASSNRLTEMAITTYTSFINLLRARIGEALRSQTETASGSYIGFSVCLAQYELDKLQPYLKTSICRKMIARTHQIPESFLDAAKIEATIKADHGIGGPENGSQPVKKKREHTEADTSRNLRNKANRPAT